MLKDPTRSSNKELIGPNLTGFKVCSQILLGLGFKVSKRAKYIFSSSALESCYYSSLNPLGIVICYDSSFFPKSWSVGTFGNTHIS